MGWTSYTNIQKIMPVKMSFCDKLSALEDFQFPEQIEYLFMEVNDMKKPFEQGWQKYKIHFASCSKLKGIVLTTKFEGKWVSLQDLLNTMSQKNKDIWKERFAYLRSQHISIMLESE